MAGRDEDREIRSEVVARLKKELLGDLLTTAEVGAILEVHPRTVTEYIRDGRLEALQLGGSWKIAEKALREFLAVETESKPRDKGKFGVRRSGKLYEKLTDRARKVMTLASSEGEALGHNYLGTEHLLLGMLAEGEGIAAVALGKSGLKLEAMRAAIKDKVGRGKSRKKLLKPAPFTPRARQMLEDALNEMLNLGHNYLGTEHLLLALLSDRESVGTKVVEEAGVQVGELRDFVMKLLGGRSK